MFSLKKFRISYSSGTFGSSRGHPSRISPRPQIQDTFNLTYLTTEENYNSSIIHGRANNGFYINGSSRGLIPVEGPGTRLMFYPGKAAFRAGAIEGSQWDNTHIGHNSAATGLNTIASGDSSTSFGKETIASGPSSHAEGSHTVASGDSESCWGTSHHGQWGSECYFWESSRCQQCYGSYDSWSVWNRSS